MKIAIISTMKGYSWAGTEEVWYHFAKLALQEGHEIILGADSQVTGSDQVKELIGQGMKVAKRKLFRPMRLYELKQRLLPDMRAISSFTPDVLLLNAGSPLDHFYSPTIWQYCQTLACPKVFYCHFNSDRLRIPQREQVLASLEQMQGLVFVSEDNRRLLQRQLAHQFENSTVILNAPRLRLNQPLEWPEGEIQFAQVARLETEWKGHEVLLEVLSSSVWGNRSWHLTIYGNGPDEGYIRRLIKYYDLDTKVTLAGYVRDMTEVYSKSHLLVLPSKGEGTPLSALEAMMCGRPVLATDVGGNAAIIEDGKSGFIAEAPSVYSLSNALERAWSSKDSWESMGKHAHERAIALSDEDPARKLLEYLNTVVS